MKRTGNKMLKAFKDTPQDKISYPWEYEFPTDGPWSKLDINKDLDALKGELTMIINGQISIVEDK